MSRHSISKRPASRLRAEPPSVRSPGELMATASSIAEDAASRYEAQAGRMRRAGADALASAYDELARQQREQIGRSLSRFVGATHAAACLLAVEGLLDDEGTDAAAVELLDPYRIFAVAVRNCERAFAFWSYVAAQASSAEVRQAAEYLAGRELERVAWLRRRRRSSYHALRGRADRRAAVPDAMESRLAALLAEKMATCDGDDAGRRELEALARQTRERAAQLARAPFDPSLPSLKHEPLLPDAAWNGAGALCEALLDRYLELAGEARDEAERSRAQAFAAELIACLRFLRTL
ncbi:rubrerythrin [Pseudochelatococcus lubricantis]|uniref:Rubrerythrin n=1 Tax=Pseudochelatococcus lubricantis TaxID=1538102 RepID=A0ABX0V605_9HYPH|nr:rubrerythrin family protein [Pseudochelatococcus lubricantis]NIJ59745.1 rubrerythrin [Pseudochelatococcus lubricantis]